MSRAGVKSWAEAEYAMKNTAANPAQTNLVTFMRRPPFLSHMCYQPKYKQILLYCQAKKRPSSKIAEFGIYPNISEHLLSDRTGYSWFL
jgi:hypothetical protein